jgi:hypothetical protein
VKLGFSLAFAEDRLTPEIHFATCQQHYPENFWNPEFQRHANGVSGIAGVVSVAEAPDRHRRFLEAFSGAKAAPAEAAGEGFAIATPRGTIEMLTPAAFTGRFGAPAPDVTGGARLGAIRFAGAAKAATVGPGDARGAVLALEAAR